MHNTESQEYLCYNRGMSKSQRHLGRKIGIGVILLAIVAGIVVAVLFLAGVLPPSQNGQQNNTFDDSAVQTAADNSALVPSAEELVEQEIQQTLDNMTIEEKVGQMVIARCPTGVSVAEAAEKVKQYHLGGYILFAEDFAGRDTVRVQNDTAIYQAASKIPLFIGVDEEGGAVNRASINPSLSATPFRSPQELFQAGGLDLIRSDATEKSNFLKNLGVNLNFAPVADVSTNPDDFIYARSFGQGASATAEYVKTVVTAMRAAGMGSTLKHFPGYGNNVDTHTGVAYDQRDYATFVNADFLPFEAGIEAGANVVLVAHNVVENIDPDYPASISAKAHQILREDLHFEGLIITDDLVMEGVRSFAGDEDVAVLAVQAGNDLLCSTDFEVQIPALIEAVSSGKITESRLDKSVKRILTTKKELGI